MIDFIKISPKRHIAKTISYRIISSGIGFLTIWLVTGSVEIAATFGVMELFWKPLQYYFHERIWYRYIKYGVIKVEEPIKPDLRIMDSVTTGVSETVTTTGPKRLVYTKKTE
jgi:uncharacterized membrane protein